VRLTLYQPGTNSIFPRDMHDKWSSDALGPCRRVNLERVLVGGNHAIACTATLSWQQPRAG
jgi:hypothetical protein